MMIVPLNPKDPDAIKKFLLYLNQVAKAHYVGQTGPSIVNLNPDVKPEDVPRLDHPKCEEKIV